jgi:hypothetical protein
LGTALIPMHYGTFPLLTGRPDELAALAPETEVWAFTAGTAVIW